MRKSRPVRTLLSERLVRARVRALGRKIRRDYRGKEPLLVGVLHGSFIFMADLARAIGLPLTCDFVKASSYAGTRSKGTVRFEFGPTRRIRGRHVLVVEDIVDTGLTAKAVLELLKARKPASLRLCALLRKVGRERVRVPVDYLGFTIPDVFVVGYGLDCDDRGRHLPYVGVLGGAGR